MTTKAKRTTDETTDREAMHDATTYAESTPEEATRPGESIWQGPSAGHRAEKDKSTAASVAARPLDKLGLILEGDVGSIAIGVVTYTPVSGSDGPRSQRDLDALH